MNAILNALKKEVLIYAGDNDIEMTEQKAAEIANKTVNHMFSLVLSEEGEERHPAKSFLAAKFFGARGGGF